MSRTIPELMADDHLRINGFLKGFKEKPSLETFERFVWELEKHIFVEEKAIFTMPVYDPSTDPNYSDFRKLMREHEVLLDMVGTLKRALMSGTNIEIKEFLRVFSQHMEFEEKDIYPRLDRQLSNSQKRKIIHKITNAF